MDKSIDNPVLAYFFVSGEPRPKQSFRVGSRGGYQPARVKAWQTEVAIEAQRIMREMGRFNEPFRTGKLSVTLSFYLGDKRKVDIDNLCKPVLDGMNKIVIGDDQQVCELRIKKYAGKEETDGRVGVQVMVMRCL